MSGVALNVTLDSDQAETRMAEIEELLRDANILPLAQRALGESVTENTRLAFVDGASPYGERWAPLKLRSGQPLRDTGRLANSITWDAEDILRVGTNVCYASVHQFGATIKARPGDAGSNSCGPRKGASFLHFNGIFAKQVTIPARPFLPDSRGLPEEWREDAEDAVTEEIREALGL